MLTIFLLTASFFATSESAGLSTSLDGLCAQNPHLPFCKQQRQEPAHVNPPVQQRPPTPQISLPIPPALPNHQPVRETSSDKTLCKQFQDHFFHYCFNVKEHPQAHHAALQQSCPLYYRQCPEYVSHQNSVGTLAGVGPAANAPAPGTKRINIHAPCLWTCKEQHCTQKCKCEHYYHQFHAQCHGDSAHHGHTAENCVKYNQRCEHHGHKVLVQAAPVVAGGPQSAPIVGDPPGAIEATNHIPSVNAGIHSPCTWRCEHPHCTMQCKCKHYYHQYHARCHSQHSGTHSAHPTVCGKYHQTCFQHGFDIRKPF